MLFFARVLAVAASEVVDYALVSVSVSGLIFVNFNIFFMHDIRALILS